MNFDFGANFNKDNFYAQKQFETNNKCHTFFLSWSQIFYNLIYTFLINVAFLLDSNKKPLEIKLSSVLGKLSERKQLSRQKLEAGFGNTWTERIFLNSKNLFFITDKSKFLTYSKTINFLTAWCHWSFRRENKSTTSLKETALYNSEAIQNWELIV